MMINSELVSAGQGSHVMGHPLETLAWLANLMAEQSNELKAGMLIVTGTLTGLIDPAPSMSAAPVVEAGIVLTSRHGPEARDDLQECIEQGGVHI